ncbi:MAG: hypothetical protein O9256_01245 [Rhizobiaceae bacterium]|nr:hypothetical protein [Rhizobiaceae bacterium]MCZ8352376.1 hypothetical protein [Rhizobium sp.]
MASAFKEFTLALGLLASDPSAIGPKLGLTGYVWHVADLARCGRSKEAECLLLSSKWDWKRPQAYTVSWLGGQSSDAMLLGVYLDNQDRSDDDRVCFMVVARAKSGEILGAEFLSYEVLSRHSVREKVALSLGNRGNAVRLEIGSKQCDETYRKDIDAARRVLGQ